MEAVVFNGPWTIDIERRPKPTLAEPTDAIVKVTTAGICGSELHMYRGHQKSGTGHIMGHEFVGYIEEVGSAVHHFKTGQKVVCTFAPVCMSCFFCQNGYTNRCPKGLAPFGTQGLAGGQAEYVRVPYADGTLHHAPESVPDELLIMMSDIFPTGYYGAIRAIEYFDLSPSLSNGDAQSHTISNSITGTTTTTTHAASKSKQPLSSAVFVCLGCGPVGLCAILTARSKGVRSIYVVDSVDDRLEQAAKLGGIPLKLGKDDIPAIIKEVTDGRGADAVIEVVGNTTALRSAFDLLRPAGVLSSLGFHQGDLPFSALECYQKSLNINLGRAPVRTVFDEALEVLAANKDKMSNMITHRLPLSEAAKGYEMFEKQQARKVILIPGQ
ncbi:hypothetical protein LTR72_005125 [Exophiala xenobiotica]|nr:hypothetical protein LTR72_005125 [Exophiala xenobiotica]KAK5289140.1 hypothetical protein LTR14_007391 [Exophiala xenobiotica]KAK5500034.1 hypothetical protein LTR55_000857 [Exophiala xenobiotica]